jgi:prophage regulatory protein
MEIHMAGMPISTNLSLLRMPEVERRSGLKKSRIYQLVKEGRFPIPVKLIPGGRAIGFYSNELDEYLSGLRNAGGNHV